MELTHAGLLLLLFCSAYSSQFRGGARYGPFEQDPEVEWERMETVIGEEVVRAPAPEARFWRSASGSGPSTTEAKKVPEYLIVSASNDQKEVFKPEKGARPLPDLAKEMLLVTAAPTPAAVGGTARTKLVEILCHLDRIYVRISREVFKTRDAYKHLKVGNCPVNQGTKDHYYLLYLLKTDCGWEEESNADFLSIRNVLHYNPTGVVLREMPFAIPLQCKYFRFFHSYEVGFYPKLQGGTVFKRLRLKHSFTLTLQDASGNDISGTRIYTLGQPMYFEARRHDRSPSSGVRRMYVNKCFMTASQNPNSNPKFMVIDNQGCMIDSKMTQQAKFLTAASKMVQKFSVGALLFKDTVSTSTQQLFMHCSISLGRPTPTRHSKACNYDSATQRWKELYGDDSVCTCCDSTCGSAQPKASRNVISTDSWKVSLTSKDEYAELEPLKSSDADMISLDDPDMADHSAFMNYWEHDY